MTQPIITADNLAKKYTIQHSGGSVNYRALRDVLAGGLKSAATVFRRSRKPLRPSTEEFWALSDISFEIKRGEVVGIIGRNGAGKSTLLKILSRITDPTKGRVTLRGRVASLLEVGTGFHPELTGRENIYLNGSILGMKRKDIDRRFDEIVDFAGVEKFLDTPVKRYSSGMYVRLAFAVSAHLEPEILIVDEVLAVGDGEFQRKCLGKMDQVAKCGRTVLFVSHNMVALEALCSRAIILDQGKLVSEGDAASQIASYLGRSPRRPRHETPQAMLGGIVKVSTFSISPNPLQCGEPASISLELIADLHIRYEELCILIYSILGVRLAIVDLRKALSTLGNKPVRSLNTTVRVNGVNLVEGDYELGLWMRCNEFTTEALNLSQFTVTSRPIVDAVVPYAARHRGLIELDVDVDMSTRELAVN